MASIRREIHVDASSDRVWDALRDVGRIHERLVRGFVSDCRLEGNARVALLIIVCDEEVTPPDLATTLEVIAPMSSSRFLSKASRGHHGRRNRHQVGSFPGLQTGLCTRSSRQLC